MASGRLRIKTKVELVEEDKLSRAEGCLYKTTTTVNSWLCGSEAAR